MPQAQDLAQDTFLRAYRVLLRGERFDNARAWLYCVASRLAANAYRRSQLLRWLPLSDRDPAPSLDVEGVAVERTAVQAALRQLPPRYRVPLVLYLLEGWSIAEVAETLALSVNAVKMRLSRAREFFRAAYRQEATNE